MGRLRLQRGAPEFSGTPRVFVRDFFDEEDWKAGRLAYLPLAFTSNAGCAYFQQSPLAPKEPSTPPQAATL